MLIIYLGVGVHLLTALRADDSYEENFLVGVGVNTRSAHFHQEIPRTI
jgi:hypothetical protein